MTLCHILPERRGWVNRIRWFNVISRTLISGVLHLSRDAVGVFYSSPLREGCETLSFFKPCKLSLNFPCPRGVAYSLRIQPAVLFIHDGGGRTYGFIPLSRAPALSEMPFIIFWFFFCHKIIFIMVMLELQRNKTFIF